MAKQAPQAGLVEPGAARRLESGIPRLDYILKGGFLRGGLYTVTGPPGGGKTILGNQLCFNFIKTTGARCLYLTLLVESHAKMMGHLASLSFFRAADVPEKLTYVSGYQALKSEGTAGLLKLVRATLQSFKPTILVIDGVESLEHAGAGVTEIREFCTGLQAFTGLIDCTTFLLSASRLRSHAENTLADGVIELTDQLIGPRAVRELTVHKFRGSDYLRGKHEVEITSDGIVIHPRTEIQFDKPPGVAQEERGRMPFGIKTLDTMLSGGPVSGTSTALLGAPGTGKTALGLAFLVEGARRGQHGTYFGFYEPPPRLLEKAESIGMPLAKYCKKGLIEIVWQPPLEHMMDSLTEQLLEKIRQAPKQRRRLFIDGIEGFRAAAVYPERMPRFLSAFTNQLRMSDVTTLISEELELFRPELRMPNPELANVVESVITLRYVELQSQLHRLISVMKMRESKYDSSIREFRITDDGIEVASSFKSAESILSGQARVVSGGRGGRR